MKNIEPIEIEKSLPQFGRNREASTKFFQTTRTRIVKDKTKYGKKNRKQNNVREW